MDEKTEKNKNENENNEDHNENDKDPEQLKAVMTTGGIIQNLGYFQIARRDGEGFTVTMSPDQLRAHAMSCKELADELEDKHGEFDEEMEKPCPYGPTWDVDDKPGRIDTTRLIIKGTIDEISERFGEDIGEKYGSTRTLSVNIKNQMVEPDFDYIQTPTGRLSKHQILQIIESMKEKRIRAHPRSKKDVIEEFGDTTFKLDVRFSKDFNISPILIEGDEDTAYLLAPKS